MLKIKSNTNEFTIIFSEKIEKKINAEKFSVSALSFFLLQYLSSFFCFSSCFLFSLFRLPFFSLQRSLFFCFFFQPYLFKVQPFTCCSLTQPKKPKCFSTFQPKRFCFSSATLSSCFFCFILFWFSPKMLHSAQNVFFFSFLQVALYFSAQVFSSKPFSAASCLFI